MASAFVLSPTGIHLHPLPLKPPQRDNRNGSASLISSAPAPTPTQLALPSRFPSAASPRLAVSPSGHAFLYAEGGSTVWEYDSRGRRVSEIKAAPMSTVGKGVGEVLSLARSAGGAGGERVVVFDLKGRGGVWERKGREWKMSTEVKGDGVAGEAMRLLARNAEGTMWAMATNHGIFRVMDGLSCEVLAEYAIPHVQNIHSMHFPPTLPGALAVIADARLFLCAPAAPSAAAPTGSEVRELQPFSRGTAVRDVAFAPLLECAGVGAGADGKRRGGLCAVLGASVDATGEGAKGEVALLALDKLDSAPKTFSFGEDLMGIGFVDGATLVGWTASGGVLYKDLRALAQPATKVDLGRPISELHLVPQSSSSTTSALALRSRPSVARSVSASSTTSVLASTTTDRRTPLAEMQSRNGTANANAPSPAPPVPALPDKDKALMKGVRAASAEVKKSAPAPPRMTRVASVPSGGDAPSVPVRALVRSDRKMPGSASGMDMPPPPPKLKSALRTVSAPRGGEGDTDMDSALAGPSRSASAAAYASAVALPPTADTAGGREPSSRAHSRLSMRMSPLSIQEEEERESPRGASEGREVASVRLPDGLDVDAEVDADVAEQDEDNVHLTWALRPRSPGTASAARTSLLRPAAEGAGAEAEADREAARGRGTGSYMDRAEVDELRALVAGLQLDLLRQGRVQRAEIRRVERASKDEMHELRAVVQRQQREIERLRGGC